MLTVVFHAISNILSADFNLLYLMNKMNVYVVETYNIYST